MKIRLLTAVLAILCSTAVFGQKAALKTNLLYDAGLTLNGGIEFRMAPKWTFDLSANLNAWTIDNRHWNIEAEIGLGWVYTRSDVFECRDCGQKVQTGYSHNYVGPTKAAINLIYEF